LNKYPLVSIIIPTYNRKTDLIEAINSVCRQTYKNWELIIIDNYSTDGTLEMLKEILSQQIRFYLYKNKGIITNSRNLGIKYARGEYIALLDSDDLWKKDKLKHAVYYLEKGSDLVFHDLVLYPKYRFTNFLNSTTGKRIIKKDTIIETLLFNGNYLSNSGVVFRKVVGNKIQYLPIDESLKLISDFHAWIEMSISTEKFKKIHKDLGFYKNNKNNITNSSDTITSLLYLENKYSHYNIIVKLFGSIIL